MKILQLVVVWIMLVVKSGEAACIEETEDETPTGELLQSSVCQAGTKEDSLFNIIL